MDCFSFPWICFQSWKLWRSFDEVGWSLKVYPDTEFGNFVSSFTGQHHSSGPRTIADQQVLAWPWGWPANSQVYNFKKKGDFHYTWVLSIKGCGWPVAVVALQFRASLVENECLTLEPFGSFSILGGGSSCKALDSLLGIGVLVFWFWWVSF